MRLFRFFRFSLWFYTLFSVSDSRKYNKLYPFRIISLMHINTFYLLLCTRARTHTHTHTHTRPGAINSRMCNCVGQYNTNPQKEKSGSFHRNLSCPKLDNPWFNPPHGQKIYIFSKMCRPYLGQPSLLLNGHFSRSKAGRMWGWWHTSI